MAVYAIGDIQGCYDELLELLDLIQFDPRYDRLWFTGDLVNRGPKSLDVLRYVKQLGASATTVLGNHDFHLLAMWRQHHLHLQDSDSLTHVFEAPDHEELLEWLRQRPLLHHDPRLGYTMVHAGLPPQWGLQQAQQLAAEVEEVVRGEQFEPFLHQMYGNKPKQWSPTLTGWDRLRFIVNCMTRLRFCTPAGRLDFKQKGGIESSDPSLVPWFQAPSRQTQNTPIIFGHWSTLGYRQGDNVYAIDSGCLWGGKLTALRIDTPIPLPIFSPCPGQRRPRRKV